MNRVGFLVSSLLVVLALLSSTLFVVDQRQFGVVYALGQIKEVILEPGLNFKLPPPFQNVSYIDRRLLTLDSTDAEPMLTAEKQRVVIDWYVRWRIISPSEYIRNVGLDERAGANQLNRPSIVGDPGVLAIESLQMKVVAAAPGGGRTLPPASGADNRRLRLPGCRMPHANADVRVDNR